jgi:hypothetical protein
MTSGNYPKFVTMYLLGRPNNLVYVQIILLL